MLEIDKEYVENRYAQLIDEFKGHCEAISMVSDNVDRQLVFESWSIQKIGNLQVALEDVVVEVKKLRREVKKLREERDESNLSHH